MYVCECNMCEVFEYVCGCVHFRTHWRLDTLSDVNRNLPCSLRQGLCCLLLHVLGQLAPTLQRFSFLCLPSLLRSTRIKVGITEPIFMHLFTFV